MSIKHYKKSAFARFLLVCRLFLDGNFLGLCILPDIPKSLCMKKFAFHCKLIKRSYAVKYICHIPAFERYFIAKSWL